MARTLRRNKPEPAYEPVPVRQKDSKFPKVNYSVPDSSYWRVDNRSGLATAIVTVAPDGLNLGWDSCGVCSSSFYNCLCASGISLPNSVGYIFTTRGGIRPAPPQPLSVAFEAPKPRMRSLRRVEAPKRPLRRLQRAEQPPTEQKPRRKLSR